MKVLSGPTIRTYPSGFRLPDVKVTEFATAEAVPHYNAEPHPDGGPTYADTEVAHTQYQFEAGTMTVKRTPDGKAFSLSIQASDQYRYQREFSVELRRVPGTSDFSWQVTTYMHPFHTPDQFQDTTAGKAQRFIERLIELVEKYPSLVFNNSGETSEAPPRYRPRHEGFVQWHTALLNGAEFTVKLLDR